LYSEVEDAPPVTAETLWMTMNSRTRVVEPTAILSSVVGQELRAFAGSTTAWVATGEARAVAIITATGADSPQIGSSNNPPPPESQRSILEALVIANNWRENVDARNYNNRQNEMINFYRRRAMELQVLREENYEEWRRTAAAARSQREMERPLPRHPEGFVNNNHTLQSRTAEIQRIHDLESDLYRAQQDGHATREQQRLEQELRQSIIGEIDMYQQQLSTMDETQARVDTRRRYQMRYEAQLQQGRDMQAAAAAEPVNAPSSQQVRSASESSDGGEGMRNNTQAAVLSDVRSGYNPNKRWTRSLSKLHCRSCGHLSVRCRCDKEPSGFVNMDEILPTWNIGQFRGDLQQEITAAQRINTSLWEQSLTEMEEFLRSEGRLPVDTAETLDHLIERCNWVQHGVIPPGVMPTANRVMTHGTLLSDRVVRVESIGTKPGSVGHQIEQQRSVLRREAELRDDRIFLAREEFMDIMERCLMGLWVSQQSPMPIINIDRDDFQEFARWNLMEQVFIRGLAEAS